MKAERAVGSEPAISEPTELAERVFLPATARRLVAQKGLSFGKPTSGAGIRLLK